MSDYYNVAGHWMCFESALNIDSSYYDDGRMGLRFHKDADVYITWISSSLEVLFLRSDDAHGGIYVYKKVPLHPLEIPGIDTELYLRSGRILTTIVAYGTPYKYALTESGWKDVSR